MPELCQTCPLRGDITCKIIGKVTAKDVAYHITKNYGFEIGTLGALVDEAGNVSEVLNFSQTTSSTQINALQDRIDHCDNPTESTGFISRLTRKPASCNAIGELAIDRSLPLDTAAARSLRPSFQLRGKLHAALHSVKKQLHNQ